MPQPPAFTPTKLRVRRKRRAPAAEPAPIPGPVLADGSFAAGDLQVTLFFDRDVAIGNFDPAAIVVDDPASGSVYAGTGSASVVSGFIVFLALVATGPSTGADLLLTATTATGIVAADTGGPWAGVTDFALTEG